MPHVNQRSTLHPAKGARVKSPRSGSGPSPAGESADERRRDLVRRLLSDAAAAAEVGDPARFALRADELGRMLPRVGESFAQQVRVRLCALGARLARHETSTGDRASAISKLRWFVLDTDALIHRQHPDSPEGALCGHLWLGPIWQGKIGRNDVTWCPACQREISLIKQASRVTTGASEKAGSSLIRRKGIAEQRLRNEAAQSALAADLSWLRAERGPSIKAVSAGSPGLGKRR
jgi:hypothetical protein